MFLVPYRRIHIVSPHSAEVLAERLRLQTSPRWPWFRSPAGQFDFVGSVSPNDFRLLPTNRGRNTYQPWLLGRMTPRVDGTEIRIVQTLHPAGIIIIVGVLVLGLVLGRLVGDYRDIIVGLFVLHCLTYFIGFLPQARRAEARIRQLAA
jgi:hypothetical protein